MIKEELFLIKITKGNIEHYKNLGYDVISKEILVTSSHLQKGSHTKITGVCDFCNNEKVIEFKQYNIIVENGGLFSCSKKCSTNKRIATNIKKYGVEYFSQTKEYIEQLKKTSNERYGVDNYSQSKECKDKVKSTCNEKYGVDNVFQTMEIKEKLKKTNIEKYGVNYYTQTDECKERYKQTCGEKYGVNNFTQTDEYKEKSKKTSIERYGVDSYSQTEEFKERYKQTCNERYGVDNYSQGKEYKGKVKSTCNEKYGVDNYSQTEKFKEKCRKTSIERYGYVSPMQSEDIKNKLKKTNIEKYGFGSYSQTDEFKEKLISNSLEKYGVNNYQQNEEYRKENYNIAKHPNYIKYLENKISLFKCDCGKDHEFEIHKSRFYNRNKLKSSLCTICYPAKNNSKSNLEIMVLEFIKSIYSGEIISGYRDGLEIDIFLPELNIGFEFNGLYWHSDGFVDNNYHLSKLNYFNENGIQLYFIWEDDWKNKQEVVKSNISYLLNKSENIDIGLMKIKEVETDDEFLNLNYIQGHIESKIKIGLYSSDELISLMAFDKFEHNEYQLSIFCNRLNTCVMGAASKLLNQFIEKYNPSKIICYSNKDWPNNKLLSELGFNHISSNLPSFKYVVNGIRVNEAREEAGFNRVYDCGQMKFEMILKK